MWRLGWVVHGLEMPLREHLFDANIFFPAKGALALSDATLIQGLLGAPMLWSGVSLVATYSVRFAQLGLACIGVLASLGLSHLIESRVAKWKLAAGALCVLAFLEYGSGPNLYRPLDSRPNSLSRWLAAQRSVILFQWPAPSPSSLPDPDPFYVFESTKHWTKIVNGYSGFYPEAYLELLEATREFPKAGTIDAVRQLGTTHIVVHPWRMTPAQFETITRALERPGLEYEGCFNGPFGIACAYRFVAR